MFRIFQAGSLPVFSIVHQALPLVKWLIMVNGSIINTQSKPVKNGSVHSSSIAGTIQKHSLTLVTSRSIASPALEPGM
jgi:hypothetical protein